MTIHTFTGADLGRTDLGGLLAGVGLDPRHGSLLCRIAHTDDVQHGTFLGFANLGSPRLQRHGFHTTDPSPQPAGVTDDLVAGGLVRGHLTGVLGDRVVPDGMDVPGGFPLTVVDHRTDLFGHAAVRLTYGLRDGRVFVDVEPGHRMVLG